MLPTEQGTCGHAGGKPTYPSHFHEVGHHYDACGVFMPHHPPEVIDGLLHWSCSKTEHRLFFLFCKFATGKFLGLASELINTHRQSPHFSRWTWLSSLVLMQMGTLSQTAPIEMLNFLFMVEFSHVIKRIFILALFTPLKLLL